MVNRELSESERIKVNKLLKSIRSKIQNLSKGDKELQFAINRRVFKQLEYDERNKPAFRKNLKRIKFDEQKGRCALCDKKLPIKNSVLDRLKASRGYTKGNTQLIHKSCDEESQFSKKYK